MGIAGTLMGLNANSWLWLLVCIFVIWVSLMRVKRIGVPPGPFSWPVLGCVLSLRQPLHKHFMKMAARYGPVMYLEVGAYPVVVANNWEIAKEVLTVRDADFAFRPPGKFYELFSYGNNDIAFAKSVESWRENRKATVVHFFTQAKLNETSCQRESEIKSLVSTIKKMHGGCDIDVREAVGEYVANTTFLMLFNKKPSETSKVVELVNQLASLLIRINIGDFFPALDDMDLQGFFKKGGEIMTQIVAILNQMIADTRHNDINASLDHDSIMGVMINMISAGVDTSQGTIEWAMAEVLSNSTIMEKAKQEIDDVVGMKRLVKESDIPMLKYVQDIVKETFRMHPAAPLAAPHYNMKATTVAGYKIPAKCRVFINVWAIGRDPARWENPEEFNPDRFLGRDDLNLSSSNFDLIPFSAGRRQCVGSSMAMRSVTLAVATLLHAFEWERDPGSSLEEEKGLTITCKLATKLIARAHPRLHDSAYCD